MSAQEPLTAGNPHQERSRYLKAAKVAERLEGLFGTAVEPTNEAVRICAQLCAADGTINARPLSDRSCEVVRTILATRDAFFRMGDDAAAAAADRAARAIEERTRA